MNIQIWNKLSNPLMIKTFVLIILVLFGLFGLISCSRTEENIKVGVLLPLSGPAAYYGEQSKKGIEIANEEIIEHYPKLKLEFYYEDSLYTPKGGIDAYRKLMDFNKLDAVITAASPVSLAILPLAIEDKILQMAIFSSADKYITQNDLSFRISTTSRIETAKLAEFIKNFNRLGIIYLNNDFGVSFKESLKNELLKLQADTKIIGEESFLLETSDFRTSLIKIKENNPGAIFIIGTASHYSNILKQAKELDLNVQFLSMRSAEDPILIKNAKEAAEGLIYTYPFDATKDLDFVNQFKRIYNSVPDAYAAEAYEGFKLTAMAFAECGKDYECIKDYLTNLKNYNSVFGKLSFDDNGDVYYDFFFKTVKDGQFVKYTS
ncbi:ABC transporter substrate-binding protein [Candidatus Woesearchaeota archaeon]|nr:ABC transporter substrate-binding protein [Candidatus Woesearchaeota archaeon]